MEERSKKIDQKSPLRDYILMAIIWSLLIAASLGWNLYSLVELALSHILIWITGLITIIIWRLLNRRLTQNTLATERALRESENRYRSLVESSPICIHEIGLDGRISSMNRAGLNMMGMKEEREIRGFLYVNAVGDADRERIGELLTKAFGGVTSYFEFKASGSKEQIFKSCFAPIRDENGKVEKLMGITEDITDRRRLEQEREQYYRFFMLSIDPMCIADPFGCFLHVNPAFVRLTGYTEGELIAKPFLDFIVPEDRNRTAEEMKLQVAVRPSLNFENRYLCKDGSVVLLSWMAYFDRNDGLTYATARDITKIREAEEALRAGEARYRSYVEVTSNVAWVTDAGGQVTADIPSFRKFTGQTYEEVKGLGWSKAIHPDDLDRTLRIWKMSVEAKSEYNIEYRLRRHDGEYRYLLARGVPVLNEDGSVREWMGTGQDITERRLAEEKIRRMNEELELRVSERTAQLEAANKELEAFSYSVSHDLRTPLRAIDGFSRILIEDYTERLDEEGRRLLNIVRNNTLRMSNLIDDILKFSRTGRTEMSIVDTDIAGIIQDILDQMKSVISERRIMVNLESLPNARCDRALIRQVFENLIANAIKFASKKEVARIEIGGRIEEGKTVYYVRDNGVGFDMQYIEKLFGVFQRLHGVEEFEGTGIGLAIVKRIVTRHGGSVWAEGEVGKGASFYFSIPDRSG